LHTGLVQPPVTIGKLAEAKGAFDAPRDHARQGDAAPMDVVCITREDVSTKAHTGSHG